MSSPSLTWGSLRFCSIFSLRNSRIPSDFCLGILDFILGILDFIYEILEFSLGILEFA